MQPAYLPWIGYFQRLALSDMCVTLDHVALDKNSKTKFANRNRIRTPEGKTWLTVPLRGKPQAEAADIRHLEIDNGQTWAKKHQNAIKHSYSRAPFYRAYATPILALYDASWPLLIDLASQSTFLLQRAVDLDRPSLCSSTLPLTAGGSDLILEICRHLGASEYVSGPFGRDYLDRDAFARAGIRLLFHEYEPIPYPQTYPGFEPCLSFLDLLFNLGPETPEFLKQGARLLES